MLISDDASVLWQIMQGLLDQYTLAGNRKGLDVVVWMADYFGNRVKNLIQRYTIQRHWEAMNEETGGFNDVMYQLYTITVILCRFISTNFCFTWITIVLMRCSYSVASMLPAERPEAFDDGSSF